MCFPAIELDSFYYYFCLVVWLARHQLESSANQIGF